MTKSSKLRKYLAGIGLLFMLSLATTAFEVAIIGVKPYTSDQWVASEKISGTLYKTFNNQKDIKVLTSNEVDALIGDRKAFLEKYLGGVPLVNKVDAVIIGEIKPAGASYQTAIRFYNIKSGQNLEYVLAGNPLTIDKNLANGLLQRLNVALTTEHKIAMVSGSTVEILSGGGVGIFKGQVFNVYRKEDPNPAFIKYARSPLVKVGEIEVTSVNGNRATAKIIKEDPYLRIKIGDFVSRQIVVGYGTLEIDSIPRGATVFIDDFLIGKTPLTIRSVPEGTYKLVFKEPLHEDLIEQVKVKADTVNKISPVLPEKLGRLQINSNIQGDCYLNNVKKGKTPMTLDLPKGFYRLELSVPGYPNQEQSVWISPGLSSTVFFHVSGSPAEVYFETDPTGASVYLDGSFIANSPYGPFFVEPGYHDVKMIKPGWRDWNERVLFTSGKKELVKATLELPPGTITFYSEPARATIKVDGKEVGKTPFTYSEAGPGLITVEISKDGYRSVIKNINIYSNERLVVEEKLERQIGTLTVQSLPEMAEVYLDGIYRGKTPLTLEVLPVGEYTLELTSGNLASRSKVKIMDRERKDINVKLIPYWQLKNIEKRIVGSIGADFQATPLIVGLNTSFPVSKNLTLKADLANYGGDFGGGYGEYAYYNSFLAGSDYYFGSGLGIFSFARYRAHPKGDSFGEAGAGLVYRVINPELFVLYARLGASYQRLLRPYWEMEGYIKTGISNLIIGAKLGSSPISNIEGRIAIGLTF